MAVAMTCELRPGTRVRTAAALSAQDWSPDQNKLRQAGVDGTIMAVHTPVDGSEPWHEVAHGPATTAKYSAHELTPIRERATEAAAPSPEQTRLDELGQRLDRLAEEAGNMRDAVARELAGLEAQLEHYLDRLRALEQDSKQTRRRAADRPEAAIAAVRLWCELPEREQSRVIGWFNRDNQLAMRATDALKVLPELLRLIEGRPPSNPYAGAHDDSGLDVRPADEIPPVPAPPTSDAYLEIERLQAELEQAHADVDMLTAQRDGAQRRNAQALETLRGTFELRDDCNLITDAADDACEYPRELMRALGYDGVDGPLPEQCLRDVRTQREQIERLMARCQVYDRLSEPGAYNEPDPDKLAAEALIAGERADRQGQILSDLREIFGDEAGHGLRQLATRAVSHAAPVLRLLESHSAAEVRRLANGIKWWAADVPAHSVTRAGAEHFAEVADLADRNPDGDTGRDPA